MSDVSLTQAAELAANYFGINGTATSLPGEIDDNFRIEAEGRTYVLKISPPDTSAAILAARQFVMTRLAASTMAYAFPAPPLGHEDIVALPDGRSLTVVTWIEGVPYAEAGRFADIAQDIGLLAGTVVRGLEGFDHPALHYEDQWDLAEAHNTIRELSSNITLRSDRALVDDVLDHLIVRAPLLQKLPKQVIHGDINDLNVLVDDGEIAGLIDFGDTRHSWRIGELAIAATYIMLGTDDPIAIAEDVVTGYVEVAHATRDEAEAIYDLIRARLAVSVCVAASRRHLGNEHHTVSEDAAWELLERLDYVDAIAAATRLAAAAGYDAPEPTSTILERRDRAMGHALSLSYSTSPSGPLHIIRGEGAYLYDTMGRRYLDCVNNVAHVGHSHPDVVAAATDQMFLLNTNTRYLHDNVITYAERLLEELPDHLDVMYFTNSGSEANELALRMARATTERRGIAVLDHGYHGNTSSMVELSPYKFNGPGGDGQPEWVTVLPLSDPYRPEPDRDYRAVCEWLLDERPPVAGLIAESIVGCGGQVMPDTGDLHSAYEAVKERGGVCIADEIQTGFGRVGSHFWAFELHGLEPDIVTMGKPIGNGHPMGAVATTADIADDFNNGMEYFNTFGGNPVSAAIGIAVLEVIEEEGLQDHARKVGSYLLTELRRLMDSHDAIGDVRGNGLFLGMEFVTDRESKIPNPAVTAAVVGNAKENGVLLSIDGPHHNVIKIKPPLVFSTEDADRLVGVVHTALGHVAL
ncbi:MAG: aminotransferase class III-fold pyridoxal phosphate-dependent enzyme [Acidimicrobiia bacterium]|nr:aminotransferase class III-fold pyridoxal phosphate-dependent enzyme [Acidimicrobiia bacterium]